MERERPRNVCCQSVHLPARVLLSLLLVALIQGSSHRNVSFTVNSLRGSNESSTTGNRAEKFPFYPREHVLPRKKKIGHNTNGGQSTAKGDTKLNKGSTVFTNKHSSDEPSKLLKRDKKGRITARNISTNRRRSIGKLEVSRHRSRESKKQRRRKDAFAVPHRRRRFNRTHRKTRGERGPKDFLDKKKILGFRNILSSRNSGHKSLVNILKETKNRRLGRRGHKEKRQRRVAKQSSLSSKHDAKGTKTLTDKTAEGSGQNEERLLHRYKRKLDLEEPPPLANSKKSHRKSSHRKERRQIGWSTFWPVREAYRVPPRLYSVQGGAAQTLRGYLARPQSGGNSLPMRGIYSNVPRRGEPSKPDPWLLANERNIFPVGPAATWRKAPQQFPLGVVQRSGGARPGVSAVQALGGSPQRVAPRTSVWKPEDQTLHPDGARGTFVGFQPQIPRPVYGVSAGSLARSRGYIPRQETPGSRLAPADQTANPVARQQILQQIQMAPQSYTQMHNKQKNLPVRYEDRPSLTAQYDRSRIVQSPSGTRAPAGGGLSRTGPCDVPVGLQSGAVTDDQLSSSSELSRFHSAARGRLDATPSNGLAGSWCASHDRVDRSQFLQVDLGRPRTICRLATQGQPESPNWVTSYKLAYSADGKAWSNYEEDGAQKVFVGNYDRDNTVVHDLTQPISARYFRFQPQSWHFYDICLRAELYTRGDGGGGGGAGQGLLVYLNFDQENEARAGKRTDVGGKKSGSCGHVARLNNGSEVLLDGSKMAVKPRSAVTMAAWIRLDNNKGRHSIFDTVGGHSRHQNGQYHFEVEDGKLRWFHRNELGQTIFNAETGPLIPASVWTHVVGVYDSRIRLAKIYVNGLLKGVGTGKGLLSQDWSGHAGIGQHKGSRFLDGEVDEFRIYSKALSRSQIQSLVKRCDFAQGCGGVFHSPEGVLESPDWPRNYDDKHECAWRIALDPGSTIALQFTNFSLDPGGECARARLQVYDGPLPRAKVLGTYCGQRAPASVVSSGNQMEVLFSSQAGATGQGFRLRYTTRADASKKQVVPAGQARKCSVTKPQFNVTLVGGIHSGVFSEVPNAHDMSSCVRHCCLRPSCQVSFMIKDSCYLVDCFNARLCKTKAARPSSLAPQISYVEHLKAAAGVDPVQDVGSAETKSLAASGSAPRPSPQCHHTAASYNVTLVGGINAGKFSTYGTTANMDECIRHCCHDDSCDVAFMIQGNCYTVECEDREGCQLKRAKPSPYHPTIAFVYRGNAAKPFADPLPGTLAPSEGACKDQSVSKTLFNVTLIAGIKSGTFTDKGLVRDMAECSSHCCSEDTCNVAFLIRDNCFLVACQDYESCHVKPALSEYYHPRLAYVNWSPPDQEIPTNHWYASLGCWKDVDAVAMPSLEGSDALLSESFYSRVRPTDKCAQVARKHAYRVFAIQKGGACQGGPKAGQTFNQFGQSPSCKDGRGGLGANSVYELFDNGTYHSLGCWRSSADHLLAPLELADARLMDSYGTRRDPVRKCAEVARSKGFETFAIQDGGMCYSGPDAETKYKKLGLSRDCRDGIGGVNANSVYKIIGKERNQKPGLAGSSLTAGPVPQNRTTMRGAAKSNRTGMTEHFVRLQDGQPQLTSYTAEPILHNVTLKYGIKAGKFLDKGHATNMSECIRACGREEACTLAFMLGRQCFSVVCHSEATCRTKAAFSPFYKPQLAFVKHKNAKGTALSVGDEPAACRTSGVLQDVTLVGGIDAGKFHDLGSADNMASCVQRCCQRDDCEVAFMLEAECYGVTCVSKTSCQTRRARNPDRYHPQIAYIYRGKMADQASPAATQAPVPSTCWDGEILINQTLVGGINAGVFTDNGKADDMSACMRFCCGKPRCDLAFMIEDDCYSVSCQTKGKCEPRRARPTHYRPRIAFTRKFQATRVNEDSPPSPNIGTVVPEPHGGTAPVRVEHSCSASPIEYNKTLKMGLHSGVFRKIGKVDSMDDCIEMSCKQPHTDVAFMLGTMCYSVRCYSDDLCRTVPVFGDNLAGFNLKPAISFLRTKARVPSGQLDLAVETEGLTRDVHCRESTISYNVTLRGGISSGNFTERSNAQTMRDCVGYCCDDVTCDLAFMFGTRCYSVACENEKLCQAVLAKPSSLEPRISYVSRGLVQSKSQVIVLSENDASSTCREDEVKHSEIFTNKSLAGGLESGTFKFLGKFRTMNLCMRRCCASASCDLAYMVDKNCFSVKCYSAALCKISGVPTTNGHVQISTILQSSSPVAQKHSMVIYVVIGVVAFMAGAGGIVWAVCMFLKRHRLKMRNLQNQE